MAAAVATQVSNPLSNPIRQAVRLHYDAAKHRLIDIVCTY